MVRLSVAIPDSALVDYSTKLDKSRKISQIARCAAIFGVESILVYRDGDNASDRSLLVSTLRYMETPQFLRKRLFPKTANLKFAGMLHPLAIPSHDASPNPSTIQAGKIREGVAVTIRGIRYVDVGIGKLLPLSEKGHDGRVSVRFGGDQSDPRPAIISRDQIPDYWGYVVRERSHISRLIREWRGGIIIATKAGSPATPRRISRYVRADASTLVAFGSPERDVHEIAGGNLGAGDMIRLNFFPRQHTRSVRLEEAMLGALTTLNMGAAAS